MAAHVEVVVAPLGAEDRAGWQRLAEGYKTFYETVVADAGYERAWQRLQGDDAVHALGARLDGRLVGIAHYFFHAGVWSSDVCHLQDLFVEPDVRGRGIARALISGVADAARSRGAPRLYWHTRANNTTARALYDKVARHDGFIRYDIPLAEP
ncbi:MAG: GNAT family N-acetyltransferase [Candidatus Dormibacteraeota bacterium]|nr:GNAT family N-acetyltransferase [Candidatus Dormibacteraeota bacterium]